MTSEAKELRLLAQQWLRDIARATTPPLFFLGFSIPDTKMESPFVTRIQDKDGKDEGKR